MFKKMGMSNGDVAMYTGLLYLPWVIKPLWSPFVDIIRTKRWWVVAMQVLMSAAFAAAAFSLPSPSAEVIVSGHAPVSIFAVTLVIFWISAFASATHDIAADGYYMIALDSNRQSLFVGIRSTFYRLASIFGQGVLVVLAGVLESRTGNIPRSWFITMLICAVLFAAVTVYHSFVLPRPAGDVPGSQDSGSGQASARKASDIIREFAMTFVTFFRKRHVWLAIIFMLLYRLPEAFLIKMMNPFLLDPVSAGGLGLSTENVGIAYGTVGVAALTAGGIAGGIAASRTGLKKSLWPMALSMTLPCLTFVYLAMAQPHDFLIVNLCVCIEQFGYGFGFTAYMLYMIYFSDGEFKTAHYSICTAFMALSMMIPGMVAGYLQEWLGYEGFFWMVMACCLATIAVAVPVHSLVDASFGRKQK